MVLLLALAVAMAGCQTITARGQQAAGAVDKVLGSKGDRLDPWGVLEPQGLRLQRELDEAVLKPVARAYVAKRAIARAHGRGQLHRQRIQDAWSAVNLFLQGALQGRR